MNNIPTADGIIHGSTNSLLVNGPEFFRAAAGNPIGYFWGYKTAGIFQNEADVAAWSSKSGLLQPDAHPGDLKLVDLNGDGVINADDKTNIGDPNPHHVFGFTDFQVITKTSIFLLQPMGLQVIKLFSLIVVPVNGLTGQPISLAAGTVRELQLQCPE